MDDIKILEEIGLKEVSKKTHIEVKNLKYIINSEFDKLNRANTMGFVKIISREYKLDLTDWLEEAKKYWDQNRKENAGPQIFIAQESNKYYKVLFALFSILLLIVILYGAYIFLDKKLNFFENPLLKNDTNYTYEETPAVSEAKKSFTKAEINSDINTTQVIEQNQSNVESANIIEANTTKTNIVENKKELNSTINLIASNESNVSSQSKAPKKTDDFISPSSKLWLGVIYLDGFKRKSFLGDGNFSIDPSKNQLITTGHGHFTLFFKGVVTKYKSPQSIKLLVKDGNISVISTEKFKKLNRGSLW